MACLTRFVFIAILSLGAVASQSLAATTINEDGLHVQPWFTDSFLILKEDVADAAANGKRVAVIFEQRGAKKCTPSIWRSPRYPNL